MLKRAKEWVHLTESPSFTLTHLRGPVGLGITQNSSFQHTFKVLHQINPTQILHHINSLTLILSSHSTSVNTVSFFQLFIRFFIIAVSD